MFELTGPYRYWACTFWLFLQQRIGKIKEFFDYYESSGKLKESLENVVAESFPENGVYGKLENFFALWHRNRITKENHPEGIVDQDGNVLTPGLTNIQSINLESTPVYTKFGTVNANGADYYRIYFGGIPSGKDLFVNIKGIPEGDFAFQFMYVAPQGKWTGGFYPFFESTEYNHTEPITDELYFIFITVAGRDKGGRTRYRFE